MRTVVRRLRAQGVLFLTLADARDYMASNEAAYWVWRDRRTALSRFVRRAVLWQRLLWRVLPLALPRDRELAAQQGIAP